MYMNSNIPAAFASACAGAARADAARAKAACGHVAPWAAPVQGIRMSTSANKLDGTGYPAFEDPL